VYKFIEKYGFAHKILSVSEESVIDDKELLDKTVIIN